jgi:hypothetical protein
MFVKLKMMDEKMGRRVGFFGVWYSIPKISRTPKIRTERRQFWRQDFGSV